MEDPVGYGKPPKEHRFTSENQPVDRPTRKGVRNRSTIARKWLEVNAKHKNPLLDSDELQDLTEEDLITLAQIKKAREGDTKAYQALMDSTYGQPKQKNEIEITGIAPIIPGDEENASDG